MFALYCILVSVVIQQAPYKRIEASYCDTPRVLLWYQGAGEALHAWFNQAWRYGMRDSGQRTQYSL